MRVESIAARADLHDAAPCAEATEILKGLSHDLVAYQAEFDSLVRGLIESGIWGKMGRMTWARDAPGGILLFWQPADGAAA